MPKHSKHDDAGSDDGAAAAAPEKKEKKGKKEKRERSRSNSPKRDASPAPQPQASEGGEMLDCQDCQQKWEFTADEKAFFEEKGFSIPIRCGPCRKIRKQQKEGGGGGGGGRGGFGGRGGGGGGGDRGSGCFNCGEEGHRLVWLLNCWPLLFSILTLVMQVLRMPQERWQQRRRWPWRRRRRQGGGQRLLQLRSRGPQVVRMPHRRRRRWRPWRTWRWSRRRLSLLEVESTTSKMGI
jgi:hypothetical protein